MSAGINIGEAARDFPAALARIKASGDGLVLLEAGKPVAKLEPIAPAAKSGREIAATWNRRTRLDAADAEAFGCDLEAARRDVAPVRDAWA